MQTELVAGFGSKSSRLLQLFAYDLRSVRKRAMERSVIIISGISIIIYVAIREGKRFGLNASMFVRRCGALCRISHKCSDQTS
jgi:hypothetical protein